MDKDELINVLASPLTKKDILALSQKVGKQNSVSELFELCFIKQKPAVAFRAAWVLENVSLKYVAAFLPYFHTFITRLPEQKSQSCQRHFTNILLQFCSPKAPLILKDALATVPDQSILVETIVEWLIASKTPIAVRVNCLEILLYFSDTYDWLKDELKAQTEYYLRDGSPAMQSRGRRILKQLHKK